MRRHSVIFAAQVVEPDPAGTWVRHEEAEQIESQLASTLKSVSEELSVLRKEHKDLQVELELGVMEREGRLARQAEALRAAKARLKTHGHTAHCDSRYGSVDIGGAKTIRACNCGLDQWMKENGVG